MKAWMIRGVTTCALVVGSVLLWAAQSAAGNPDELGKFPVGHTTVAITLTGVANNGSTPVVRPIDVEIWYPADKKDFVGAAPTVYRSRLFGVTLDPTRWDPLSWQLTSAVARENVDIDLGGQTFPVVIFSHGATSTPLDYFPTLEHLASHGFVVAAPWHTRNNQDDTRTNFVNDQAGRILLPCLDGRPNRCLDGSKAVGINRTRDIDAILDRLPEFFGDRVNMERVGVMGHSAGSITGILAAGGSTSWGIPPNHRVDSVMGLAMISDDIIDQVDLANVTVPTLLVAAELDANTPPARSIRVYNGISSTEKAYVLVSNAVHRSFSSGFCSLMQAAGAITQASPVRALLDRNSLTNVLVAPVNGSTLDYCPFEAFTTPVDIRDIVASITGFNVTETNVPRTGVTSDEMHRVVSELAVTFFSTTLDANGNDGVHFTRYLAPKFLARHESIIEDAVSESSSKVCANGLDVDCQD